jgi:hypothetical protein
MSIYAKRSLVHVLDAALTILFQAFLWAWLAGKLHFS